MISGTAGTVALFEMFLDRVFSEISLHHTPRVSAWKTFEFGACYDISC